MNQISPITNHFLEFPAFKESISSIFDRVFENYLSNGNEFGSILAQLTQYDHEQSES